MLILTIFSLEISYEIFESPSLCYIYDYVYIHQIINDPMNLKILF